MSAPVGPPRAVAVDTHRRMILYDGWRLCSTTPGSVESPEALGAVGATWSPAVVPGTVASAMELDGPLDLERMPNIERHDWWYCCEFDAEPNGIVGSRVLRFDGLATLADVWLNGQRVLESSNMFVAHEVDVSGLIAERNTLAIRFASVEASLGARRPRPRWRTKLVDHQQLRWIRTTLLGRMPGWSPPVRAVGPWRAVALEYRSSISVESGDVTPSLTPDGVAVISTDLVVRSVGAARVLRAALDIAGEQFDLVVGCDGERTRLSGSATVHGARPWWPHTHGDQPLYAARVVVSTDHGNAVIDLGDVAFRRIEVATDRGQFEVRVNGTVVFCRGACWTTPSITALGTDAAGYNALLSQARDAGMNMIRIGGTMVYEDDAFYDCCDRLGILVWQDFMFANMDYPADDPAFLRSVRHEVTSTVARLRRHACLTILCGGSEVEQQAAMVGLPSVQWAGKLFHEILAELCAIAAPNVPYWPCSPGGGAMPFHAEQGVAHYYGVGAYLRPLEDARRSNVKFASECLAFANIPEQAAVDALLSGGEAPVHHPRWKARVPRDHGAGWDFEDVRDHYLAVLFNVDPMRVRYADMQRYLAMSRVVTGEVMERTIGEWRRGESRCRGALVWFYQDLWPGAGWGVIDAGGRPKAAYYALKRAMQPVALAITDEGVNGLHIHAVNDRASDVCGELELALYRDGATLIAARTADIRVPARGVTCVSADALLGQFHDVSYAYRFGPPGHDLIAATLRDSTGSHVAAAFHFPLGLPNAVRDHPGLAVDARRNEDGSIELTVRADRFAQSVEIECGSGLPDDNYFHLAPGSERVIRIRPGAAGTTANGYVQPLNARVGTRFTVAQPVGVSV